MIKSLLSGLVINLSQSLEITQFPHTQITANIRNDSDVRLSFHHIEIQFWSSSRGEIQLQYNYNTITIINKTNAPTRHLISHDQDI